MGQLSIAGTLLGGPVQPGSFTFPQAIFTTQLSTTPNPRPFSAATGVLQRRVNQSQPGWTTLSGVGTGDTVQRGDFLYLRSDTQLTIRISQIDPLNPTGSPLVKELNIAGLCIVEFSPSSQLVLLEAQGSATIEYAIVGQ